MSEIRLAMCQILRKVQILPSLDPEYVPKVMAQVVLRSENGIRMRFAVGDVVCYMCYAQLITSCALQPL